MQVYDLEAIVQDITFLGKKLILTWSLPLSPTRTINDLWLFLTLLFMRIGIRGSNCFRIGTEYTGDLQNSGAAHNWDIAPDWAFLWRKSNKIYNSGKWINNIFSAGVQSDKSIEGGDKNCPGSVNKLASAAQGVCRRVSGFLNTMTGGNRWRRICVSWITVGSHRRFAQGIWCPWAWQTWEGLCVIDIPWFNLK